MPLLGSGCGTSEPQDPGGQRAAVSQGHLLLGGFCKRNHRPDFLVAHHFFRHPLCSRCGWESATCPVFLGSGISAGHFPCRLHPSCTQAVGALALNLKVCFLRGSKCCFPPCPPAGRGESVSTALGSHAGQSRLCRAWRGKPRRYRQAVQEKWQRARCGQGRGAAGIEMG